MPSPRQPLFPESIYPSSHYTTTPLPQQWTVRERVFFIPTKGRTCPELAEGICSAVWGGAAFQRCDNNLGDTALGAEVRLRCAGLPKNSQSFQPHANEQLIQCGFRPR